jgi:DNA uptake protein ComE-like DNA-binding protein
MGENGAMRIRGAIAAVLIIGFAVWTIRISLVASAEPAQSQHAPPSPEMRVDINHASLEELLKVPGMTHSWARRIVRFRPYRTKQDLLARGIVTGEVYNRIKDYIIAHREKQ